VWLRQCYPCWLLILPSFIGKQHTAPDHTAPIANFTDERICSDLSTANILLRKPNDYISACLADFGIAVEVTCAEVTPSSSSSSAQTPLCCFVS
jgi:hypothetical protein